jgi:hypothetical protein
MSGKKIFILSLIIFCCCSFALIRQSKPVSTEEANHYMWDQLHRGNYDSIGKVIQKLRLAWEQSPNDAILNDHLGFIYLWKFCERARVEHDTSIFQNVSLSNSYFKKAIELDPADERIYSLQAAAEMCLGKIRNDRRLMRKAYRNAKKAVPKWPQFNRFSLGAAESVQNKSGRMFWEGLRYQWITMDECSCKKLSKEEILEHPEIIIPQLFDELQKSEDPKMKRACWNTWIAPHNFEGYLLNFGDMLVKKGKLKEAKKMYEAIKLSPAYREWPFQSILEERIKNIGSNEIEFNKAFQAVIATHSTQIFINSKFSCVGCHQMSQQELETMKREKFN